MLPTTRRGSSVGRPCLSWFVQSLPLVQFGGASRHRQLLLQFEAVDTFCFVHEDAAGFDERRSCKDPTNGGTVVRPGIDIATHLNIVGSDPDVEAGAQLGATSRRPLPPTGEVQK
jgi:hypothetical protein